MAYSKQTWDTTSYVNPTRMNHIEDGIKEVEDTTVAFRSGILINSGEDTIDGYGTAQIELKNGIAKIVFEATIKTNPTNSTFTWGLNRDFFTELAGATITPTFGGICEIYNSDGTKNFTLEGYGGTFQATGQFWQPARNYDYISIGGWSTTSFATGIRIKGVCYGTY